MKLPLLRTPLCYIRSVALCVLLFLLSVSTALAYDKLAIEVELEDAQIEFELTHLVDGEEVEEEFTYSTTNLEEAYELLAEDTGLSQDEIAAAITELDEDLDEDTPEREAAEAIAAAEEEIAAAVVYIERLSSDSAQRTEYESWLTIAEDYLEEATAALADDAFARAESWAEKAEDKAELITDEDDDSDEDGYGDKDRGHGNDTDKCDEDNPGKAPFCDEDDDAEKQQDKDQEKTQDKDKERDQDRYKEYGKTNDRAELQRQLRELLQLLISLLQQQMAAS